MLRKKKAKIYRDAKGVHRIRYAPDGRLDSKIYFDLSSFSDLCENTSALNFKAALDQASHGLSCVVSYQDYYFSALQRDENDKFAEAKLFITCRFANSIYASMRLACMGLYLDSIACLKTAFEALQYSRLISLDFAEAPTFLDPEKSLRPVVVRKKLEALGHDVEATRNRYGVLSTFTHVGGTGETLTLEQIGPDISFRIGGYVEPELQKQIIDDCHKACGDFIAYGSGIREENVEKYHEAIKALALPGGKIPDDFFERIPEIVDKFKNKVEPKGGEA